MPQLNRIRAMIGQASTTGGPQPLAGNILLTVDPRAIVLLAGGVNSYDYVATLDGLRAYGPVTNLRGIVFQILFKGVRPGNYSGKLVVRVSGPSSSVECTEPLAVKHTGNQTTQVYVTMTARQCTRGGPVPGPVS